MKAPHQLEGEDAQFMCQGLIPFPPPAVSKPWKNSVASSATDQEADDETDLSADLHDIKIIKKEGRL